MEKLLHNSKKLTIAFTLINVLICFNFLSAQSTANYTFTTAATGSLASDLNSNTVDMTTGTTPLLTTTSTDDAASAATNIGFDFYLMGNKYTQFSVSSNGGISLGSTAISSTLYQADAGTTTSPSISAFASDLAISATALSGIRSKVIGTAPNRCLVIEFKGMTLYFSSNYTNDGTWQVRLYETTGAIEFVYGDMKVTSSTGPGTVADKTTGIGFSTNTTATNFVYVTSSANTATTSGTFTDNPTYGNAVINNLNSASNGSRRFYKFDQTAPSAPTGISFTNLAATSMTLNWTDVATNELGYVIYYSTDNTNFSFSGQIAANSSSSNITGLVSGTQYYFQVYAVREGALSSPLTGSQTTPGQATFTTTGTSSFIPPVGVNSVDVQAWGAGGGGGSRTSTGQSGGGGGGAFASSNVSVTGGTSYNLTVGAGGTAANNGGNSTFNTSSVVAEGGKGVANNTTAGGAGGLATNSNGTTKFSGGTGGTASGGTSGGGGGGAGSTGVGGNANIGTAGTGTSDNGGTGGAGRATTGNGNVGAIYGAGGSGACRTTTGSATGGTGAQGLVVIGWTCPTYSIATGISATTPSSTGTTSTVTVTSTSGVLPNGTYTVTYSLRGANTNVNQTASMVISSGTGSFTTIAIANAGATTITITNLSNGTSPASCSNAVITNNTTIISINSVTYNTAGTSSFKVPNGITCVKVDAIGGGGGGSTITSNGRRGGGGGGGAFASGSVAVTSGSSYTVVVGAGGGADTAGGNSTFNSTDVKAAGGSGGTNNSTVGGSGGTTGNSTGNIVTYKGGEGADGGGTNSGGGGGGAGTTGAGGDTTTISAGSGTTLYGGNGGVGVSGSNNGNSGNTYGGGGSGAVTNSGADRTGGSGANGIVTLTWIDATDFSTSATAAVCPSTTATVTVTSTTLADGTYTVTYNTTNPTTTGSTASMTFSGVTGTFTTVALTNATSAAVTATITITSVTFTGWTCGTTLSTGNTASVTVNAPPTSLNYTSNTVSYCVGTAISTNSPTFTGSAATGYTVSPALPAGLSLNATTGDITGNPTTATAAANYTVTVTNACGNTTRAVNITVNVAPTSLNYTSNTVSYCVGTAISTNSPTFTGSAATGYTVSPALPAGLSLNATTGDITGNPTTATAAANYTVTVTNACGNTTRAVNITVNVAPTSLNYTSNTVSYCVGTAISTNSPTFTGSAATGYTVSPALPAGLSLNATTGVITGNPTTASAAANYTVTVTNACGNTTRAVNITVNVAPTSLNYTSNTVSYCVGTSISTNSPTFTGSAATGYTVSPALPAGLSLNATTGDITGNPTTATAAANYTVTVTNSCGNTTRAVNITVNVAPTSLNYTSNTVSYCVGTAISTNSPTFTGSAATGYTVSPALPAGLSLNATTGVITGNPTTASAAANYTVTVTNACGNTTRAVNITVNVAPTSLNYTSNTVSYCVGTSISTNSPTFTGSAATGYTVSPALPAGLSLNATTGDITGNPTTATAAANYTVTVTNSCGNTTRAVNITVNVAPTSLNYTSNTVSYCVGTAISTNSPTFTGSAATGYTVSPALPAGLSLNATTGVITGNPTTASAAANYTVTVTNACGNTTRAVNITVNVAPTSLNYTSNTVSYCVGTSISTNSPTFTGSAATGYTVSPALPAGLSLNATTGDITGNPTTATAAANYTVTVTNSCGNTTRAVNITVNVAPTSLNYTSNTVSYCVGTAISTNSPTFTGSAATGYTVSPALPAGLSLNATTGVITGNPTTATAAANYTVTVTNACSSTTRDVNITVTPDNTVSLTSAGGTNAQTVCINTAITNITYSTTGATGATFSGLPTGVTGNWAANVVTISGSPSVTGGSPYSYTVTLTGGCGSITATGTITVTPNNTVSLTSAGGTNGQTVCINTAITNITYSTTGATGATFSGLPTGVTGNWAANVVTISGSPSVTGGSPYSYTVTLTGGCGSINATGTITVTPNNTVSLTSAGGTNAQTVCINTAITNITYSTTGATGATFSGLPTGVTGNWAANVVTISGSPSVTGGSPYSYTVTLTGGCGSITATGTITVTPNNTVSLTSAGGTNAQTVCINTAITNITYSTTGATGATFSGLPTGVTGNWAANIVTISGSPSVTGGSPYSYTVTLTGGCGSITASGTIAVTSINTVGAASSAPTVCINTALTSITHSTTGATGIGSATGLPTGVTAGWASNTITISGTPTASGTFNYSIPLTGGCGSVDATGTITVRPAFTSGAIGTTGQTICYGNNPTIGINSVTAASGGDGVITYKWQANGVDIPSSNAATYDPPSGVTVTTTYTRFAKDNTCNTTFTISSGSWVVTVSNANTWTGSASTTSWTTAGNWSCGLVPISTTNVTIGSASFYPVISSDVSINSLTLNSGTTLKVNSSYDLTVTDAITNNGTLTIENTANLVQVNNVSNTGSGTTVVKRNSSALKRLDYTLWSSPVTGQGVYAFSKFTFPGRFYVYDEANNNYNNAMVGLNVTGLQYPAPLTVSQPEFGVDGTDVAMSGAGVKFDNGKGYLIRVPYNHPTTPTVYEGTFTGVANNGNISAAVAVSPGLNQGFNAVGNPYPSRLNVHNFIDGNTNITGTLYFWRKTNTTAASTSYATLTKTAYTANGSTGGDTGTGFFPTGGSQEQNWVINVGQGFIVKATSGTSINFTNAMRRSLNANQFFKNSTTVNTANNGLYWLNLTDNTGVYSQMAVGYSSEGTVGFDRGIDGENINKEFYLTSLIGANEYSIQGKPDFDSSDVVPLSYKALTAGNYSISIDHTDGLFTDVGQPIYLRDNLTSTEHDLHTGPYTFTSSAGTFTNRFEIIYQSQLGVGTPTFTANNVIIYNQNNEFVVKSGNIIMSSIKVFDIRGRLLEDKKGINANQTTIGSGLANEVLLVQITSVDGITVTKKVVR